MRNLLIILIFPLITSGQRIYKGAIINKVTKEKISFATVGLIKENTGINADDDGNFSLVSNKQIKNDTLIFSCVGFETLRIPTTNLKNSNIELEEKVSILSEVVVRKKVLTSATLNDFDNCGKLYITTQGYLAQLAQRFVISSQGGFLTEVKICRIGGFFQPEKTIFRIRVYDMDTATNAPSRDLCSQIIEVKTKNGLINVNLEKYKITIPNNNFFVAVEWLKIPYNERKETADFDGQKKEMITYKPSIGTVETKDDKLNVWFLDYKNKWRLWKPWSSSSKWSNRITSISATVKY